MNLIGPIESSTLLPKIHRNSMLPAMWRIEACMNIEVKTVCHVGIDSRCAETSCSADDAARATGRSAFPMR